MVRPPGAILAINFLKIGISHIHWSNEHTMIEYIREVIVLYVKNIHHLIRENKPAVVIMDNFKGQITETVNTQLEENDIHVCLLPANTTDRLQPMDISVNKPAKDFDWYSNQISQQLEDGTETTGLKPVDLSLPVLKAKWMHEMSQYISDNPQIIVNGFIRSGI